MRTAEEIDAARTKIASLIENGRELSRDQMTLLYGMSCGLQWAAGLNKIPGTDEANTMSRIMRGEPIAIHW